MMTTINDIAENHEDFIEAFREKVNKKTLQKILIVNIKGY